MASELMKMIEQISREKGIDRDVLISALEEAVNAAARRKHGPDYDLEVRYNEELGEIEVFEFKEVVEEVTNERLQISLDEAYKIDAGSELGDSLGVKIDTDTLGRVAAQSAKQVIMQRFKEAERDIVYDDFRDRKGEIINGIVQRFDRGSIIVDFGRTEGELPAKEQIPRESFKQGDRIRAYILDIKKFSRGPQIILSRTHPNFVAALFENEVPEISEGIVQIIHVAREPGSRAKIAVESREHDVDPVGACVGMKGSRVQAVVQELRGEKIDIVTWNADPAKFICNGLAPAEITRVIVDEDNRSMEVVVPDDQLSLAIGKRGQNVRLASKLTGWRLDVVGENVYNKALKDGYKSLLDLPGVGEKLASSLYEGGIMSAEDVAATKVSDLLFIDGISESMAAKLIEDTVEYISREKGDVDIAEDVVEDVAEDVAEDVEGDIAGDLEGDVDPISEGSSDEDKTKAALESKDES